MRKKHLYFAASRFIFLIIMSLQGSTGFSGPGADPVAEEKCEKTLKLIQSLKGSLCARYIHYYQNAGKKCQELTGNEIYAFNEESLCYPNNTTSSATSLEKRPRSKKYLVKAEPQKTSELTLPEKTSPKRVDLANISVNKPSNKPLIQERKQSKIQATAASVIKTTEPSDEASDEAANQPQNSDQPDIPAGILASCQRTLKHVQTMPKESCPTYLSAYQKKGKECLSLTGDPSYKFEQAMCGSQKKPTRPVSLARSKENITFCKDFLNRVLAMSPSECQNQYIANLKQGIQCKIITDNPIFLFKQSKSCGTRFPQKVQPDPPVVTPAVTPAPTSAKT